MDSYLNIFQRFVPAQAAHYCLKLYEHFGFEFKIKKARQTKFGDYKYDPSTRKHIISINNDLNAYAFLITYLHEVAHLVTFNEYKNRVNPHGREWKENFRKIAQPVLNEEIFEPPVLLSLKKYLKNPKASSCSDPILYQVLSQYDQPNGKIFLKDLGPGDEFEFNGRTFRYISKRRTRMEVKEIQTGKKYLIPQLAEVIRTG